MSSHITYSCPVCGTPVGRTDGDDEGFFLYQSEITCQKCGHKFIVGCYYEWENLTPELKKSGNDRRPSKAPIYKQSNETEYNSISYSFSYSLSITYCVYTIRFLLGV